MSTFPNKAIFQGRMEPSATFSVIISNDVSLRTIQARTRKGKSVVRG